MIILFVRIFFLKVLFLADSRRPPDSQLSLSKIRNYDLQLRYLSSGKLLSGSQWWSMMMLFYASRRDQGALVGD